MTALTLPRAASSKSCRVPLLNSDCRYIPSAYEMESEISGLRQAMMDKRRETIIEMDEFDSYEALSHASDRCSNIRF